LVTPLGQYLSAFQSALWNRALAKLIQRAYPNQTLPTVELRSGPATFPALDPTDTAKTSPPSFLNAFPLPSARLKLAEDDPALSLIKEVAAEEDMELRQIRVKYPRDSFFSKSSRNTMTSIDNATCSVGQDDLRPKRCCMHLSFDLPRGSYATMLIKRLTLVPVQKQDR
jgi:tRNA pseudouridine13 synthase